MQPNEQEPQQLPPNPDSTPIQPIRRTVMQPLSSEDEIRRATASSDAPTPPSTQGDSLPNTNSPEIAHANFTEYESAYEGGLITEPIRRPGQVPSPYNMPQIPVSEPSTMSKNPATKVIAIIAAILIIGALGIVAWLFLFNRVSPSDLVQENVNQSTYLRPKQWSQISIGSSSYGNKAAQSGKSTALIAVDEFPQTSQVPTSSEEGYSQIRKLLMEQLSDSALTTMMSANAPMGCQAGTLSVTKNEDTKKNDTTVGLVKITSSCKKDGGTLTMKMRLVAGVNDGRVRMVIVGATVLDWAKNGESFQQMLDGVEERKIN